ncbi:MAG: sigma-54 dependent transcriptional regulator [Desulforhabdus sp.]|jgi:DNA-binding NtrC family response regulator|nr:sigma-54 dependent transcriptional regulator [Desulforhabdus sp.]
MYSYRILVIDDEQYFLDAVRRTLVSEGFNLLTLEDDPTHVALLIQAGEIFDIALIDIDMPVKNGLELLEMIKLYSPDTECIMVSGISEVKIAVDAIKKGAYDYLVKPIMAEDLVLAIKRALERKRLLEFIEFRTKDEFDPTENEAFQSIVGTSKKILRILKEAELHARSEVPILITGESGTGKELLARAVHLASPRRTYGFTAVNMAAMPVTLFDAEFFGHIKGAFTGAEKERSGYLQTVNRGTLFLDEIGAMVPELQAKLLRVLQEGEYMKLGASTAQKADIRFIAATNENLDDLVKKGQFRKDLYYRLKGAWLHLPPLREHREDIPLLVGKFLQEFGSSAVAAQIEEEALLNLQEYNYPGNVRELKSIIRSGLNLAQGQPLSVRFLPDYVRKARSAYRNVETVQGIVPLVEIEKLHILKAYQRSGRNKSLTARLLGISLSTLRRKLSDYGMNASD